MNRWSEERAHEGEFIPAALAEEGDPLEALPSPWTYRFLPRPRQEILDAFLRLRAQSPRDERPRRPDCPWDRRGDWGKADELRLAAHTWFDEAPLRHVGMVLASIWMWTDLLLTRGRWSLAALHWLLSAIGLS